MGVMVIACYRPKPEADAALLGEVKKHLPLLRAEGLVAEGPSLCGRAGDGTIVEVFVWKNQAAIDAAHENSAVQKMWETFADLCDYVTIGDLEEAKELFSPFEAIDLSQED